jgi:hypothetical protein
MNSQLEREEAQHIRIAHDNKTAKQRSEEMPYRIYRPAEMQRILDGLTDLRGTAH